MSFIRITVAYLCLKIIDFDAVHFSERCSKEVISFFWHSVYIIAKRSLKNQTLLHNIMTYKQQ